jgi:hypothetical protein
MSEEKPKNTLAEIQAAVDALSPEEIEASLKEIQERHVGNVGNAKRLTRIRPFTIEFGDTKDAHWNSVRPERTIKALQGASFGFAEEIIGLIEYTDGSFLVGIGESMRPFIELYDGTSAEEASDAFIQALVSAAYEL